MLKHQLNWRRPLFYLLLPTLFMMAFLGFPLPVAPPPPLKAAQEMSATVKKKKRVRLPGELPAVGEAPAQGEGRG